MPIDCSYAANRKLPARTGRFPILPSRSGRALLWVIAGSGLGAVTLFAGLFTWVTISADPDPDYQLDVAIRLLDEGKHEVPLRIAKNLQDKGTVKEDLTRAKLEYVLGVGGSLATADNLDIPEGRWRLSQAADHLQKANDMGFPIGHQGLGEYYLAWSYYHTYQWPKAIEALKEAAAAHPQRRFDATEMIIQAHLRDEKPKLTEALALAENWIAQPALPRDTRDRATIQKAEVLYHSGKLTEARQVAKTIAEDSPRLPYAMQLLGRIALDEGTSELAKQGIAEGSNAPLEEAVAIFRKLVHAADTPPRIRRQSAYLAGLGQRRTGRRREALGTFSGIRQRTPRTAEAIAAGIEEAEMQIIDGRIDDAIDTVELVATDCADLRMFDQQWLTVADLRTRLLVIGGQLREKKDFASAVRLSGLLPPFLPKADSVRLQAESYRDWARCMKDGTAQAPEVGEGEKPVDLNQLLLKAGEKYIELADLEMVSPRYPDTVWSAIECFQGCEQYDRANELLAKYIEMETRTRRPRGLHQLASNYFNMGQLDKALVPLEKMILDHPLDALSYESRLMASRIYNEQGNLTLAAELLTQNLYDGALNPSSEVWRESLMELGNLLYRQGELAQLEIRLERDLTQAEKDKRDAVLQESYNRMLEASDRLRESVSRYPDDPRSHPSQYMAGRSLQQAAQWPKMQLDSGNVHLDSHRRQLQQTRRDLLERALAEFRSLKDRLNEAREKEALTDSQTGLLRGCYFGEADTLFDLERYEEAVGAYRSTGSRFLDKPESLEALVQVARCQMELGRKDEAKRTLMQAEQVLSRIPPESDPIFSKITRYDREQWKTLLAWLQKW